MQFKLGSSACTSGIGLSVFTLCMCMCVCVCRCIHLQPYHCIMHTYQTPPVRILLLGARGSGKTEIGRRVASSLGIFHVALRDYLQEQLLAKMKRPPLIHEDEWDPVDDVNQIVEEEDRGNGNVYA